MPSALRLVTGDAARRRSETSWSSASALGFGLAQIIAIGPTSKEAAAHYRRALALSHAMPDRGRERFLATWGVWFHTTTSGPWRRGRGARRRTGRDRARTRQFRPAARSLSRPGPDAAPAADFDGMSEAAQEVIRLYDRKRHRDHAYYFGGHDSRVCARSFYALSLWGQGFLDQAAEHGMAVRRRCPRPRPRLFARARAATWAAMTMSMLKDVDAMRSGRRRALSARRAQQVSLAAGRRAISSRLAGGADREITTPGSSRC